MAVNPISDTSAVLDVIALGWAYELDLIADAATLRPAKVDVRRHGIHRRAPPVLRRRDVTSDAAANATPTPTAIVRDSHADVQVHQSRREIWLRPRLAGGP
jgi:hypothetical protein